MLAEDGLLFMEGVIERSILTCTAHAHHGSGSLEPESIIESEDILCHVNFPKTGRKCSWGKSLGISSRKSQNHWQKTARACCVSMVLVCISSKQSGILREGAKGVELGKDLVVRIM